MEYLGANAVFGLVWWFLNGLFVEFQFVSATGDVYELGLWLWVAIIIVFIFGSSLWLINQYRKPAYTR